MGAMASKFQGAASEGLRPKVGVELKTERGEEEFRVSILGMSQRVSERLDILDSNLKALTERMAPFLLPGSPTAPDRGDYQDADLHVESQMSAILRTLDARVEAVANAVFELRARVDL